MVAEEGAAGGQATAVDVVLVAVVLLVVPPVLATVVPPELATVPPVRTATVPPVRTATVPPVRTATGPPVLTATVPPVPLRRQRWSRSEVAGSTVLEAPAVPSVAADSDCGSSPLHAIAPHTMDRPRTNEMPLIIRGAQLLFPKEALERRWSCRADPVNKAPP